MSVAHSIACRRRTRSRMRTSSARGTATGAATMHVWSSCMGCALCMCCSPASPRQPHCSRSCLSRLQFDRPNCDANTQPFSRTACERLPHSPVTEWHVAPIECIVAHLLYPTYRTSNLIISCAGLASIEKSTGQVLALSLKVSRYSK